FGSPPVGVPLVELVAAPEHRKAAIQLARPAAAMGKLPRPLGRVHIVFDMLDVLPALEQENFETLLGELLGGPTAGDSGSDDDRVVRWLSQCLPPSGVPGVNGW